MTSSLRAAGASALAVTAALSFALAAPLAAGAHVSIDDDTADPGDYALVTFKVPNESETAATTGVTIQLPTDTPFTSVRYVPLPGWTAELITTTLPEPVPFGENEITEAVTSVVFTAEPGTALSGRELGLFTLSLGAVPEVGLIAFPTDQLYSDGSVVSWNDTGDDAEYPAPVLWVTDSPVSEHGHGQGETTADPAVEVETTWPAESSLASLVVGIVGIVIGLVAVGLASLALARGRKVAA